MKKQLYNWITRIPGSIKPEHRRTYYVALFGGGLGGLFHFLMLVLFATFGVTPLAYVNIGSVFLYAVAIVLVRRMGLATLGVVLVSVELIIHQVLAVYFLGWGYGYQYYLFVVAGVAFMGHYRRHAVPLTFALLSVVAFGWLYFHVQHLYLPHLSMPEPVRIVFFWWNVLGSMLGIAIASFVYVRTAIRMERELAEQYQELREAQLMLVQSERMAAEGKQGGGVMNCSITKMNSSCFDLSAPTSLFTSGKAFTRLQFTTAISLQSA